MKRYFILFAFLIGIFYYNSVNACTFASLNSVRPNSSTNTVLNLQKCLKDVGYSNTDKDGVYGNGTINAVKGFYKDYLGMTWDGKSFGPKAITKITPKNFNTKAKYRFAKNAADIQKYID